MPTGRPTDAERFWSKVAKSDDPSGCWKWTASHQNMGYGAFRFRGQACLAHRVSYEMAYGPIPSGMYVCHHCDVYLCVRPDHLFLGTQADNLRDASEKGLMPRGERHSGSKLNDPAVRCIRWLVAHGAQQLRIARLYRLSHQHISDLVSGKRWRHTYA